MNSLEAYAATKKPSTTRCRICLSPHREQIEQGKDKGIPYAVMVEWLHITTGEEWSYHTIKNHFGNGHAAKRRADEAG